MRRGPLHLPPRLRLQEEGQAARLAAAGRFQCGLFGGADADGGCTGVAGRWRPQLDEAVDAGWLAGGPIDPSELTFKQLELNAQVVRFPSGQETEFGGQAAYLMRIFGIDGDTVTEKGLENTPDTARLAADAALKAAARRLRQRQRAGHRHRRLRSSRRIPGHEGHLVVDLRQHPPRQPSVRRDAFAPEAFAEHRLRADAAS